MTRMTTDGGGQRNFPWEKRSDKKLLAMRIRDLGLGLEGTWLEEPIGVVCAELEARGLRVRPHFWLSGEWFSPDGVPGVAVPFFLAHPRLIRLERKQMLEVEGGRRSECLKLLRHEAGHAVHHAFRLHRRRRWQEVFGKSSRRYPEAYRPNPASRRYVLHLDYWYAQAHPDEDFAESFAVWLTPGSNWRKRYHDWPALRKLEYVDQLMRELASRSPLVRSRACIDPLSAVEETLGEYYAAKHARFENLTTNVYDGDLQRLFVANTEGGISAAQFLHRSRARLRRMVARGTGTHEYALDILIKEMIQRCRVLGLRATAPADALLVDLAILLAARSVEYLLRAREWHIL